MLPGVYFVESQHFEIIMQAIDEDICIKAVHNAFHAGVNFYDTSPFYGSTKSETV